MISSTFVSWLALFRTGQNSLDNVTSELFTYILFWSLLRLTLFLIKLLIRHTKVAGWVEFKDWKLHISSFDGSLTEDSYLFQYHKLLIEGSEKIHRQFSPGPHLKRYAEEAGYKNVTERVISLPIGTWPKDKKLVRNFLVFIAFF